MSLIETDSTVLPEICPQHLLPVEALDLEQWDTELTAADWSLVERCTGQTLDVGCGPGRLTAALGTRNVPALGIDSLQCAVDIAQQRGASVVHASVFDPLPHEGEWETVLLADGNIGIGGSPDALIRRVLELLAPGGRVVVELDTNGESVSALCGRVRTAHHTDAWIPWARVPASYATALAESHQLTIRETWQEESRCFVVFEIA